MSLSAIHRLQLPERIQCKIAVLAFKVLCVSVLRSVDTSRLIVPPVKLSTAEHFRLPPRSYAYLPVDVTSDGSLRAFQQSFQQRLESEASICHEHWGPKLPSISSPLPFPSPPLSIYLFPFSLPSLRSRPLRGSRGSGEAL